MAAHTPNTVGGRPWLWARACADAGLPPSTVPYALRHTSIVRGLRILLPIRLVAAIHDTSVAMIGWHDSRWVTKGLDELAECAVVAPIDSSYVVACR